MLLKLIGVLLVLVAAFFAIKLVFSLLGTLLLVGAIVALGAVGYAAIKGSSRKQIGG